MLVDPDSDERQDSRARTLSLAGVPTKTEAATAATAAAGGKGSQQWEGSMLDGKGSQRASQARVSAKFEIGSEGEAGSALGGDHQSANLKKKGRGRGNVQFGVGDFSEANGGGSQRDSSQVGEWPWVLGRGVGCVPPS